MDMVYAPSKIQNYTTLRFHVAARGPAGHKLGTQRLFRFGRAKNRKMDSIFCRTKNLKIIVFCKPLRSSTEGGIEGEEGDLEQRTCLRYMVI